MPVPICRNVLNNPVPKETTQQRPYIVDARNLKEMCPASSDRELFHVDSLSSSDTNVFSVVDPEKLKTAQRPELGPYVTYLVNKTTPLPPKETVASMSYYFKLDGIRYCSYLPSNLRKRGTFRDQLVIL